MELIPKKELRQNAILFSLVESCKLNKVNPRKYFEDLVKDLHQGKKILHSLSIQKNYQRILPQKMTMVSP